MSNNQTLEFDDIAKKDAVACAISVLFQSYESLRSGWTEEKREIQQYVFATDTTKTTNSQLPWKNKTTIPKLCQIRDNLYANYWAALFPKRKWLHWESDNADDQKVSKSRIIEAYMSNIMDRPEFKTEMSKLVYDFIDYGNVFATARWIDQTHTTSTKQKVGYTGPLPQRISPMDIYFNLAATDFNQTPKIIRSLMTLGDFAKVLSAESGGEDNEVYKEIMEYMGTTRNTVAGWTGSVVVKDSVYDVSGFSSFADYLKSPYVEVLTLVGDFYDIEKNVLHKNKKITVVDRTRLVSIADSKSMLSGDGIYNAAWRIRQDSLLGMGPLDNLVGMQYRIDHLENLKADVFDLIAAPPLKIKGLVDDFVWGPFARINVGDEGDVSVLAPDVNALNANLEITNLENKMEEMAGSPKEAMGFRTPGEKTMYEVQRLENASARIFATKVKQFEEQIVEPLFNSMLDMAVRYLDSAQIRVLDESLDVTLFETISKEDLVGAGRIRPMAARNFAERAELVQNLNSFFQSTLGQDPELKAHFSTVKLARMFENLLDIESFGVVTPYVRLSEQQEAAKLANAGEEDVAMEAGMPTGLTPDDADVGLPV